MLPSSSKPSSSVIQKRIKNNMHSCSMQSWYLLITTIIIFISFTTAVSGLECDAPQILVGNKCQCDETDGCYRPVIYGNCAKMKRCPVGHEPDQTIDTCFPCKTGFFSNKSDCLPCKHLTKCTPNEYAVSQGNTEVDTVCASVVNIRTDVWTKPDTGVAPSTSSDPSSASTTHSNTADDQSTSTLPTGQQPIKSQSENETAFILYIIGIMALSITLWLSCEMRERQKKINGRRNFTKQKINNAQKSVEAADKVNADPEKCTATAGPTGGTSLMGGNDDTTHSDDMLPSDPPSYRESPPPYTRADGSLSSSCSSTNLKEIARSTLDLSEAPTLESDFKYSTLETVLRVSGDTEEIQIDDYVRNKH